MNQSSAVPMIVMTRHQDHVEAINKALRNAGHAVHLNWLPDAGGLGEALMEAAPEMLLIFADEGIIDLGAALEFRNRYAAQVPVLLVHDEVTEATIAAAVDLGAQDAVTLGNMDRLQKVVTRELGTHRLQRVLDGTISSARQYQRQLKDFVQQATDAIITVQEGIVVEANRSWLDLFGLEADEAMVGTPLMDLFTPASQAALKGALVACLQGRWADHVLKATAALPNEEALTLELSLAKGEFDGEPCVRFTVSSGNRDLLDMESRLTDAVQRDPATGFLYRPFFIQHLEQRLAQTLKGGVRCLAYVEPDGYERILSEVGVLTGEDLLIEFAQQLRELLQPDDLAGRFAGNGFMVLLERGNLPDAEAWAEHVVQKISQHVFKVGRKSLATTCTVGLGAVPASLSDPDGPATDAYNANLRGREIGGNRVYSLEHTQTMMRLQVGDKLWVKRIKSALMENRLRLVQQPIASLQGEDLGMFDVLVRMMDENGREVLPSEFIPVAERNDLAKNIDRWVIGASMRFCATRKPGGLFVRLSRDSITDPSLPVWLGNQLKSVVIDPQRMVLQVGEETAAQYVREVTALQEHLALMKIRFAIDGFGSGRDTATQLSHFKPDFVKIHGALMQGLITDQDKQKRVKELVDLARNSGAITIAERVEDANTVAVLWQLGVEHIQGYFVNAPEEVVMG